MHLNPKKSESFLIHADWQMSCCSIVQSDRNPFSSRSHRGRIVYDRFKHITSASFVWMVLVEQPVSTSSAAGVSVLHHCDVMINWGRGMGAETREQAAIEKRKSDVSSAFLSLDFIMEITPFTLSTSPFISYCPWQNPFSCCTGMCLFARGLDPTFMFVF